MTIPDSSFISYSSFYSWYHLQVESYMTEGTQKDYYKQCNYLIIWFNRVCGNSIFIFFYKDDNDFDRWFEYFGIKLPLHYQYWKHLHYPQGASIEEIVDIVIKALLKVYKHGDLP